MRVVEKYLYECLTCGRIGAKARPVVTLAMIDLAELASLGAMTRQCPVRVRIRLLCLPVSIIMVVDNNEYE